MEVENNDIVKAVASKEFTGIEIVSDGTMAGTSIKINGEEWKDLSSLSFNFYAEGYYQNVGLEFSTRDKKSEPGTLANYQRWCLVPPDPTKGDASVKAKAHIQQSKSVVDPGIASVVTQAGIDFFSKM